jgi:DNA gyrase subunit A
MAVIRHFEADPEERAAYLKQRRLMAGVTEEPKPTRTRPWPMASSARNATPRCRRPRT